MALHVIVGAGPVGRTVSRQLAERGEQVRIVTRSGSGPEHPAIERVQADATDPARLTALTTGAAVLYNCANPQYHTWLTDWPPLASSLLTAAERTGAVYAIVGNLYGHGPVTAPMTADTPLAATHPKLKLRADMWREAQLRHEAGRIRTVEVRGSDYIEDNSIFSFALAKPLQAGKRAYSPIPLDVPHSFTSISDVARTVIALAGEEKAQGRAWPVPTNPAMTVRALAARYTAVHGLPAAKLTRLPYAALWAAGVFDKMAKELRTTYYQFAQPFVLDSRETEEIFGLAPSDLDVALKNVLAL